MGFSRLVLIVPGLFVCVGTTKARLFSRDGIRQDMSGHCENFSDQKIRLYLTRVSRRGNILIFVLPATLSEELE